MADSSFPRRVLFVAAVALLALLAWRLLDLLVLVFGAILGALVLHMPSSWLARRSRMSQKVALLVTMLALLALLLAVGVLVGRPLADQFDELRERVPQAVRQLVAWLRSQPVGDAMLRLWRDTEGNGIPWQRLAGFAGLTLGALASAALMIVMAVYLAAEPQSYHRGLLRLLPPSMRKQVDEALRAAGGGLRGWLKGQAVSMLFIGVASVLGLMLVGAPLAVALGLINGLLAFVPFIGAIVGGVLAVIVSFVAGPQTALYVALVMFVIQEFEGNVLQPLVQRWAVRLPPALGLVAAVVFGVLFGVLGVLLSTPLMVVAMILVQRLYVQEALEGGSDQEKSERQR